MMKHVKILRGAKTDKLISISYQNADTDNYYIWDKVITDTKTMKAIDKVCGHAVCTGSYRGRAYYECDIEEADILNAINQ